MTDFIKKLPPVFQTVTERKFFDATFDQVFTKKDSDLLYGYLGRRTPGLYNPIKDFYVPEPNKDRTWWQLEATAFARDENQDRTNIFFYEDLLNRIDYYGGNTLNQDRLFESPYYSWGPPIDYDMFVNYQNYYWVEQGLSAIEITGLPGAPILYADIIGKPSYTTPPTATPPNVKLSSGMTITLLDDPDNPGPFVVENSGNQNCSDGDSGGNGINLVPLFSDITSGTIFEFLPWDNFQLLSTGRIIHNEHWDMTTWEVQAQPGGGDYITIGRGSKSQNAWSRTNKWFHIDVINETVRLTGTGFPANATRAMRPIIQFVSNLELFKSGSQFKDTIQYGINDNNFGNPFLLSDVQGKTKDFIETLFSISLSNNNEFIFFADTENNKTIYRAEISPTEIVTFIPNSTIIEGDIILAELDAPYDGAIRGETWYFSLGKWQQAFNDKVSANQAPLFQLYDHNGIPLNDENTYPGNNFTAGNKIFSYKENTTPGATVDPVLGFPIVHTSLNQASDIVFQNNVYIDRYSYGPGIVKTPIAGYYYYKTCDNDILYNNWNLYEPTAPTEGPCSTVPVIKSSKQRVIDKYVVGYGTQYQFLLSVTPYGYPACADVIVSINGREIKHIGEETNGYGFTEINNRIYVDLSAYFTNTVIPNSDKQPPVVEIQTYTPDGLLDPAAGGYFAIPQQLEANPNNQEITEISGSNLNNQFSSIIRNQVGFSGVAFGGSNNYRDSLKNRSLGSFIIQNTAPLLKTMLISSSDDLDFIRAVRFSSDEYTKFKNRYLSVALQLINQGFEPFRYHNNTIIINSWVNQILKTISISKDFSNAFAYSYMLASGSPTATENHSVPAGSSIVSLDNFIDLTNSKNTLYIYDINDNERLLVLGKDYKIISNNLDVQIEVNLPESTTLSFVLYKDPPPNYIPSTPTKVGTYGTTIPKIEIDNSYVEPTLVIIGHDGSKTVAYGDYRDQLLLELELRIYNKLQEKYRNQYSPPLVLESVKPGYFRKTRYSRQEYLDITQSFLNKWSTKNQANYKTNDWLLFSQTTPDEDLWKLYNYTDALILKMSPDPTKPYVLPGNWKGIFQYYYDTFRPDTHPWEMLGFTDEPDWWREEYGQPNTEGAWGSNSSGEHNLWEDLELGIIRRGPRATINPIDGSDVPNNLWARPGLSRIIPVGSEGNLIPLPEIFDVQIADEDTPFDGFDKDWIYGDGSPVEQAWMSTSTYRFSIQEFLYLMRPGPYGEWMFDTLGTENSPGKIDVTDSLSPQSSINWQYVQNDVYKSANPNFAWQRPRNQDQTVHAETVNGEIVLRFGYQRWISDRILALNKGVTTTFGQKVRTLDVNLGNQLAGFTNKDTTNIFIESVSPTANTVTLGVPSNNFEVFLYQSQPLKTYSYSGIVIRALADGTFVVYGYDLLKPEFISIDRSNKQLIEVSVGGTPAPFVSYEPGATYIPGDIVRYNGVYYECITTILTASIFNSQAFVKLRALPTKGGITVTYRPISATTYTRVPYGTILKTPQEVFDLMIGWGAYLETQGWKFDDVSPDTNQISNWLTSAKQFLFWLNSEWAPDASIQLSPLANSATLVVQEGYPADVETITNGVYSILDKFGTAIPPESTSTDREGQMITVAPADLATGGIYFLSVSAINIEHVLMFDNTTSFNDVIYDPLLRERQQRLRFNGFRTNLWYGKMEAPGYLIIGDQLVPNYDTIVEAIRYYYDPNIMIDNPSLEDLGRHLIGFQNKDYLDNMLVTDDVQYLFYQGAIRQKGTSQVFEKLFRSNKVQSNEIIEVFEEWALKLADFGNTIEQVSTEFKLFPEKNTGNVVVARLNYVASESGHVREIRILNAENVYTKVPRLEISLPDEAPTNSWTIFSDEVNYAKGSVVRYNDDKGNPNYYTNPEDVAAGDFDPAEWNLILQTQIAKAYVVLNSDGRISRVDITNPGAGYLSEPTISIISDEPTNKDKLYSVWQGDIQHDPVQDNIVEIDIDDVATWVRRPPEPEIALQFPTTKKIHYSIPNAGYVNFNDVRWWSFDVLQTVGNWGIPALNPTINETLWVAKSFNEDWNVYKMIRPPLKFSITANEAENLILHIPYLESISTDFGNNIAIQIRDEITGKVDPVTNYSVSIELIPEIALPVFLAQCKTATSENLEATYANGPTNNGIGAGLIGTGPLPDISGVTLTVGDRVLVKDQTDTFTNGIYVVTTLEPNWRMTRAADFDSSVPIPMGATTKITTGTLINTYWQLIGEVKSLGFVSITFDELLTNYNILSLDGIPITAENISVYNEINTLLEFKTMRFERINVPTPPTPPLLPSYVELDDYIWVDFDLTEKWAVFKVTAQPSRVYTQMFKNYWGIVMRATPFGNLYITPYRVQEELIDTSLFENAEVFETTTQNLLVILPVYDPFKNILPGLAKQNISYMSYQDPARYNITGNNRLYSENITFARKQVGQLWWDFSNVRYVYYEQPIALDGSETSFDNLLYRRDRWGQIFPGSSVDIYEWVESSVPPAEYVGSGIPRDVTSYSQVTVLNHFTNIAKIYYYFWVLNKTTKPNRENRTMAALEVARLLQNPKAQQFVFFSPIQQTPINNSYMFYNVQDILAYRGNNVQINYRIDDRDDQPHTQWMLFREGESGSLVTDQFWNKMVDSLAGYTKLLPVSDEWKDGIIIAGNLPWDIYGWDVSIWDQEIGPKDIPFYGMVLPVPDPTLSEDEKYGVTYRPRQGMFRDIYAARKVFVQAANALLKHIPIRDDDPDWDDNVKPSPYWAYQNWYADGYEDVVPTVSFMTIDDAELALDNNELNTNDIVEVVNGTADGRFILYAVIRSDIDPNSLSLRKIGIENSALLLLDTIFTTKNVYELSVQIRELLNAFRNVIFTDEFIVDQNLLFGSMLNYVLSEQRTPDWVFKTSYIYIKENNLPLSQDPLFIPNQIDNIIAFIKDVKPYHVQVRDYTSSYQIMDTAFMTACDGLTHTVNPDGSSNIMIDPDCSDIIPKWNIIIKFGLTDGGNKPNVPNMLKLDAGLLTDRLGKEILQFVSKEDVYTVPILPENYDPVKAGASSLFPYTITFEDINLNNPQLIKTCEDIIGIIAIRIGDRYLYNGIDYTVEFVGPESAYTLYFFLDPFGPILNPDSLTLETFVWFDGGSIQTIAFDSNNNELGIGYSRDNFVVNVDTKLPVADMSGITVGNVPNTFEVPFAPYVGWGDVWESLDPATEEDQVTNPIAKAIIDAGGTYEIPWDTWYTVDPPNPSDPSNPPKHVLLDNTISFKENLNSTEQVFYRNSLEDSGSLVTKITSLSTVITVFVDPLTHDNTNILPDPTFNRPGVIWIGGERIEYRQKTFVNDTTWDLELLNRGTNGTAPQDHDVNNTVFVEARQMIKGSAAGPANEAWNTITLGTDSVPFGGLWYAETPEAIFLKKEEGKAVPE